MEKRYIGKNGLESSVLGLGCMGMSEFYGKTDDLEAKDTILAALQNGITMLDTADTYGSGHNEQLIASALREWGGHVTIATKFGIVRKPGTYERSINGRPEYVKLAAEASLRRLKREVIDLYYLHRIDPTVPIEDTVGAMSDLVRRGLVRYIGLSEASPSTVRRAHAVHPLSALQTEYSLWTRHIEDEILPTIRELGIGLVAYSPLGRGFLTGKLSSADQLENADFRRSNPRFEGENFSANLKIVSRLKAIAARKKVSPAQLALAWVLSKGEDIIAIPGTKRRKYLMENLGGAEVNLTQKDVAEIEAVIRLEEIKGERYTQEGMKGVDS